MYIHVLNPISIFDHGRFCSSWDRLDLFEPSNGRRMTLALFFVVLLMELAASPGWVSRSVRSSRCIAPTPISYLRIVWQVKPNRCFSFLWYITDECPDGESKHRLFCERDFVWIQHAAMSSVFLYYGWAVSQSFVSCNTGNDFTISHFLWREEWVLPLV